mgnify:CR=1 FL=1
MGAGGSGRPFLLSRRRLIRRKSARTGTGTLQMRSIRIETMDDIHALSDLAPGDAGHITAVHAPEDLGRRLAALGFAVGRPLTLLRCARLGGPLLVRLGTTDVALRRSEAGGIGVRLAMEGP